MPKQPSVSPPGKTPKRDSVPRDMPATTGPALPRSVPTNTPATEPDSLPVGCLGIRANKRVSKTEAGVVKYPRHRYRPVSSCTGRIRTMLIANQKPIPQPDMVDSKTAEQLFRANFPFVEEFKDDTGTVPTVWLLLNRELGEESERPEGNTPPAHTGKDANKAKQRRMRKSIYNILLLRRNFNIPHYLREFSYALESSRMARRQDYTQFASMGMEWLQDPFYVLETPEQDVSILDPHYIPRDYLHLGGRFLRPILTRRFLAREIAASEQAMLKPTQYVIEGGNVLADQDFLVLGADSFIENWERFGHLEDHRSFSLMSTALCQDFGVSMLLIPGLKEAPDENTTAREHQIPAQHQALYHLDMFLALGGYNEESGKLTVFVAKCMEERNGKLDWMHPARKYCPRTGMGLNQYLDETANWFEDPPEYLLRQVESVIESFRKKKRRLRKKDAPRVTSFEVKRIPCLFDVAAGEVIVSFVNCHFENYRVRGRKSVVRRVYLPEYGDEGDDTAVRKVFQAAAKTYEQSGFTVVPVRYGLDAQKSKGGSLHCMTKVMQRFPYDSSEIMDPERYHIVRMSDNYTTGWKLRTSAEQLLHGIRSIFRFEKDDQE